MRREHVFVRPRGEVSVGVARVLTPLLVGAPIVVGALLTALAWETGSWRPAALAAIIVGGTAPFNALLVAGSARKKER